MAYQYKGKSPEGTPSRKGLEETRTYKYRREDTLANKLANRDQQLKEAREEIRLLRARCERLAKDKMNLQSRIHALKKVRPLREPRPVKPVDEGHARILAAVQEAYGSKRKVA
jgi:chromosome segregation ATPase